MRGVYRFRASEPVIVDALPFTVPCVDCDLHPLHVPANHRIHQQRERSGNRRHLVLTPPTIVLDFAGADGPLELVYRFATVEQRVQLPSKLTVAEKITQEQRVQQLARLIGYPVDRVTLGSAAESLQRYDSAHASRVNGGHQVQQTISALTGRLGRDVERDGILQTVWYLQATWQVQPILRQTAQPGAQTETEQLGYRHPRACVSMGIHGKTEQPATGASLIVAHHVFDRNANLVLTEHHGLTVDDSVLVQHVRIDPDSTGAVARVDANIEQMG